MEKEILVVQLNGNEAWLLDEVMQDVKLSLDK